MARWYLCTISIRVLRSPDGSSQIACTDPIIREKSRFFFYLKEVIQFNDPQSLILETRELRSRETNDLLEVA